MVAWTRLYTSYDLRAVASSARVAGRWRVGDHRPVEFRRSHDRGCRVSTLVTSSAKPKDHGSGLVVRRVDGEAQVDVVKAIGADGMWAKNAATQAGVKIRIVD